jgi:hypothetical protein
VPLNFSLNTIRRFPWLTAISNPSRNDGFILSTFLVDARALHVHRQLILIP